MNNRIAIIGGQCAGKTTLMKRLMKAVAGPSFVIKFAQPIYESLRSLGETKNRLFMQKSSDVAKEAFGDDIYVKCWRVNFNDSYARYRRFGNYFCDDVRYFSELNEVKKNGFLVICVETPSKVRKRRAMEKGLVFNDKHNSENGIAKLRQYADVVVSGTQSLSESELERIIQYSR